MRCSQTRCCYFSSGHTGDPESVFILCSRVRLPCIDITKIIRGIPSNIEKILCKIQCTNKMCIFSIYTIEVNVVFQYQLN